MLRLTSQAAALFRTCGNLPLSQQRLRGNHGFVHSGTLGLRVEMPHASVAITIGVWIRGQYVGRHVGPQIPRFAFVCVRVGSVCTCRLNGAQFQIDRRKVARVVPPQGTNQ